MGNAYSGLRLSQCDCRTHCLLLPCQEQAGGFSAGPSGYEGASDLLPTVLLHVYLGSSPISTWTGGLAVEPGDSHQVRQCVG